MTPLIATALRVAGTNDNSNPPKTYRAAECERMIRFWGRKASHWIKSGNYLAAEVACQLGAHWCNEAARAAAKEQVR